VGRDANLEERFLAWLGMTALVCGIFAPAKGAPSVEMLSAEGGAGKSAGVKPRAGAAKRGSDGESD